MIIPTFEQWIAENSSEVEKEYELLQDEYGDALTCFISEFKEQRYREAVEVIEQEN